MCSWVRAIAVALYKVFFVLHSVSAGKVAFISGLCAEGSGSDCSQKGLICKYLRVHHGLWTVPRAAVCEKGCGGISIGCEDEGHIFVRHKGGRGNCEFNQTDPTGKVAVTNSTPAFTSSRTPHEQMVMNGQYTCRSSWRMNITNFRRIVIFARTTEFLLTFSAISSLLDSLRLKVAGFGGFAKMRIIKSELFYGRSSMLHGSPSVPVMHNAHSSRGIHLFVLSYPHLFSES